MESGDDGRIGSMTHAGVRLLKLTTKAKHVQPFLVFATHIYNLVICFFLVH
jgi:hypothetical protein